MKNILVTGANGQLGNEIRKVENDNKQLNFFFTDVAELDITKIDDISKYVSENKIDIIINCAAYTNVDKAEDDQELCNLINNVAVENLAKIANQQNVFFFHVSTDYVFDGSRNTPYTEDIETKPLGVYGKTKLEGEQSIQNSGCNYIIIRTSWLYSEFGNNFVKTMIKLTSDRNELNVVFDQAGTPTYAADLANFIVSVITKEQYKGQKELYHFSNEGVCSWFDFAKEISRQAKTSCNIKPCHSSEFPSKVTRPSYSVLDKTKLKNKFDYVIPYWTNSLEVCIERLKK